MFQRFWFNARYLHTEIMTGGRSSQKYFFFTFFAVDPIACNTALGQSSKYNAMHFTVPQLLMYKHIQLN